MGGRSGANSARKRFVVRLLAPVHEELSAHRVLPPARLPAAGGDVVSRFSRMKFLDMLGVFVGLRLRGTAGGLALSSTQRLAFRVSGHRRHPAPIFSELNTQPTDTPCPTLQVPACARPPHGSGPGWFATPSLYDSFIRYSMPVYLGASRIQSPRFQPALGGTEEVPRGLSRNPRVSRWFGKAGRGPPQAERLPHKRKFPNWIDGPARPDPC
jgi:hypothetical protein